MKVVFSRWLLAGLLLVASGAWAQAPASTAAANAQNGPPAGFVAPAEPKPDENNAARERSQPGNNAPFWRGVRQSGEQAGITNLPGVEKGVLIQEFVRYPGSDHTNAGEAWRQVRNHWIIPYGGSLMLIVLLALALFFFGRGRMGHEHPEGGRIERFTPFERAAHWLNAIAFVLLAVSGIVMAFGKFFLLPVLGSSIFGTLTYGLKTLHNFVGPLFAVTLVVIILTFIKDNFPQPGDWAWIKKAGGMFSKQEVPSHRFNAGEKLIFWGGVLALGLTVVASGLVLDHLVPSLVFTRGAMQIAHMFHAIAAVLMMCAFFGHIYLGTIGMRGAYGAMRRGYVSEGWAKEHHELWYEDIRAGKIPAQRSGQGSAAKPAPRTREA
ncbi:formate dehydrogenase subunit gamma [Variovorax dokdonensis]|uniref:Formate dehydrogenase subunit gamma n=1 Tax=Variovorax dokdonensis TaxID=344883 RepID=A0ABT7NA82_9BURK|nr:formate dehydrogenase subunit gamma [Variovorax dokdonensis]MDM0044829.1 formate dehydrogenase subunit gamma [Variovorax dokdonensis]